MIEVENTDVNIVRNFIPMRNHMPASAYGLKAISDWFISYLEIFPKCSLSILFFTVKSWIFVSALAIDGSISFSRSSLFFWASSYNWLVRSFD